MNTVLIRLPNILRSILLWATAGETTGASRGVKSGYCRSTSSTKEGQQVEMMLSLSPLAMRRAYSRLTWAAPAAVSSTPVKPSFFKAAEN